MPYCTKADIESLFGLTNVRTWSNLENDATTADDDRIASSIAYADALIDDRMRPGPYVVPLTAVSGGSLRVLTDVAAALAGVWLYESRGTEEVDDAGFPVNRVAPHRQRAEEQLNRYLAGQDRLSAVRVGNGTNAPEVIGDT